MRPDFIILNKRAREETLRLYQALEIAGDLNYQSFFSELERRLAPFFSEQKVTLSYKGRKSSAFPTNLFWGMETADNDKKNLSRRGEIDLLHENQKVGAIQLEFTMQRGKVGLVRQPLISVTPY